VRMHQACHPEVAFFLAVSEVKALFSTVSK
jgi:hypothetical protein